MKYANKTIRVERINMDCTCHYTVTFSDDVKEWSMVFEGYTHRELVYMLRHKYNAVVPVRYNSLSENSKRHARKRKDNTNEIVEDIDAKQALDILKYEICVDREVLDVICSIYGWNINTYQDLLYYYMGYHTFKQYIEE